MVAPNHLHYNAEITCYIILLFEVIFIYDHPHTPRMHLKFKWCAAQQLAIHLDHNVGRRFDTDMATTVVLNVANTINIAIKQTTKAE